MKNAMKKLLSLALALVLVIGVCPMAAFAAGETCAVTLNVKVDESEQGEVTRMDISAGTLNVAKYVSRMYPDYTYSHYWTEATGTQTSETLEVTGDVTVEVRMYSNNGGNGSDDVTPPADKEEAPAPETEPSKTSPVEELLNSATVKALLEKCGSHAEALIAKIRELKLETLDEILRYITKWLEENASNNNNNNNNNNNDSVVTPPAADEDEKEESKPTATTYTVYLYIYEHKDSVAKEWGSKTLKLSKNSVTVNELISLSGYGAYETAFAKIDGRSFLGDVAVAIEDGTQIDLFITPAKTGNQTNQPSKPSKGERVTLKVWHNDGTSNYTALTVKTTDKLLEVIAANDELCSLTRNGYKLIGWAFEANNDDGDWIAPQHTVADDDDLNIFADWQETVPGKGDKPNKPNNDKYDDDDDGEDEVLLKIYVNGNTKSAAKVYDMASYAKDGKITLAEATKVVKKYYEQADEDDDMDVDGLFTYSTWNGGDYSMSNAKNSIAVKENGDTIIYVMVRDAQKISSGTADSTNPKTGDTIFMAVSIMALSASALAVVYFFNKKRAR